MFASIIPELVAEGANIILAASFELVDLFQDSFPQFPVYGILREEDAKRWWPALPKIDYEVPIGHLAVKRRRTFESFPRKTYIRSNPGRVERMRNVLDTLAPQWDDRDRHALRIGLMWASNPALFDWHAARRGRRKTIPAEQLGRLHVIEQALFVSVQSRQSGKQAAYVPKMDIIDCAESLDTMADTAALMEHLDLIITVDTSVAHLAGAMGKRTFVMLATDADWRWHTGTDDCVWYPNMKLFRQKIDGDWSSVIGEIVAELQTMVGDTRKIEVLTDDVRRQQVSHA